MNGVDRKSLEHLMPIGEFADTYLCYISKHNKDVYMYSIFDKVAAWVERNGGTIKRTSEKRIVGDRKGFECKIVFPSYGKRNMKEIMATLY